MKIVCNKQEFKSLVETCVISRNELSPAIPNACSGCVFYNLCSKDFDPAAGDIMTCVSDVCEIEDGD